MKAAFQTIVLVVMGFGLLIAKPMFIQEGNNNRINPFVTLGILIIGIFVIRSILNKQIGFTGLIICFIVGIGLLFLNNAGLIPEGPNPCPGDKIIMVVDGKCYGYGDKEVNDRLDKIFGPMPTKEGD